MCLLIMDSYIMASHFELAYIYITRWSDIVLTHSRQHGLGSCLGPKKTFLLSSLNIDKSYPYFEAQPKAQDAFASIMAQPAMN